MTSAAAAFRHRSGASDQTVVLDRRKWVIKVVKQPFPLLIDRGAAKALGVILQPLPPDQQEVAVRLLVAAQQLERLEARARGDDRSGCAEGSLELGLTTGSDLENDVLGDHVEILSDRPDCAYPCGMRLDTDTTPVPRALSLATDLDVLPPDRVVEQRDGYLVVRNPGNPDHYWGNMLIFDDAPAPGDAPRWEALFAEEFAGEPRVRHQTFAWDRTDGEVGAAREEFVARAYDLEVTVGLTAPPAAIFPHPRENREVLVRALDPAPGVDDALWDGIVELQVATREPHYEEHAYRAFRGAQTNGFRAQFDQGRGAWFVALDPATGEVTASCGIVVTGGRGRFQAVDTADLYRRRGICSRLVVEAARVAAERYGAEHLVIVADAGYHALGLYESLGFQRAERVAGVFLRPRD